MENPRMLRVARQMLYIALAATFFHAGAPQAQMVQPPPGAGQSANELEQGARGAQNAMFAAYSGGQPMIAANTLDFAMIGRQVLADQIVASASQQAQIQINQTDVTLSIGDNVVSVNFNWEKRFLAQPALTPELRSGRAVFMWQRGTQGWRLVGVSGESPFTP
jgi:hypothetical protein